MPSIAEPPGLHALAAEREFVENSPSFRMVGTGGRHRTQLRFDGVARLSGRALRACSNFVAAEVTRLKSSVQTYLWGDLSRVTFQGTESEHIANELIAKTREKCISASELAESSPNPPSAPRLQCSAATIMKRVLRDWC